MSRYSEVSRYSTVFRYSTVVMCSTGLAYLMVLRYKTSFSERAG